MEQKAWPSGSTVKVIYTQPVRVLSQFIVWRLTLLGRKNISTATHTETSAVKSVSSGSTGAIPLHFMTGRSQSEDMSAYAPVDVGKFFHWPIDWHLVNWNLFVSYAFLLSSTGTSVSGFWGLCAQTYPSTRALPLDGTGDFCPRSPSCLPYSELLATSLRPYFTTLFATGVATFATLPTAFDVLVFA